MATVANTGMPAERKKFIQRVVNASGEGLPGNAGQKTIMRKLLIIN